eukprot:snap_masked-scaffold_24-processed-gene-2.35-mRNA-1 protein AED:1.00 eAED:1.00 QI:0/0/0/0/1/1/4/0/131
MKQEINVITLDCSGIFSIMSYDKNLKLVEVVRFKEEAENLLKYLDKDEEITILRQKLNNLLFVDFTDARFMLLNLHFQIGLKNFQICTLPFEQFKLYCINNFVRCHLAENKSLLKFLKEQNLKSLKYKIYF